MQTERLIPVAEYVRMSTEDQKYSIPNQQDAIRVYAAEHGFSVCRTYADPGKSGVLIKKREGLSRLLRDVLSGEADFKAIIVYDVSRWGRFQNPDEAAHYEFICSNAGIAVHYCAEQFLNDGSMQSALLKAIKRTMAGEFSRELGVKVFDTMRRLVLQGYHAGALPPYGLERMLISASGQKKGILQPGERKNLKRDKVILVRGRRSEIEIIRKIFFMCGNEHKSSHQIAAELNASRLTCRGKPWDYDKVWRILRRKQYLGFNVWGKRSVKLHGPNILQPQSLWTMSKAPFKPIIDQGTFEKAQRTLADYRPLPYTTEALLSHLRRILKEKGKLSSQIIERESPPGMSTYRKHFGSLAKAYELIGYVLPARVVANSQHTIVNQCFRKGLLSRIQGLFPAEVRVVRRWSTDYRSAIEVDGRHMVSVLICGKQSFQYKNGTRAWILRISPEDRQNIALICLVDLAWENIQAYYLLPPIGDSIKAHHHFHPNDALLRAGRELKDLSCFCDVVRSIDKTGQEKCVSSHERIGTSQSKRSNATKKQAAQGLLVADGSPELMPAGSAQDRLKGKIVAPDETDKRLFALP